MGGILGGSSNAKQARAVGSLQVQTSQAGGVIPLIYGTTKVSPNLLDYDDFTATPSAQAGGKGKGGGGGKGGGQQYMYSASLIMGVCRVPSPGSAWLGGTRTLAPSPDSRAFRASISGRMGKIRTSTGQAPIPPRRSAIRVPRTLSSPTISSAIPRPSRISISR